MGECKYPVKKKKIMNTINENLDIYESDDESDNGKSNESWWRSKLYSKVLFNFMDLILYD